MTPRHVTSLPLLSVAITSLLAGPTRAQASGVYLGHLTWPEAERRLAAAPLVILPFGAGAKEHGPHLPLNADQVVMEYLIQQAVDSIAVVVAPPIVHGWFPAFRDFPGTEVRDPEVFADYVFEVASSLVRHGAQRLVLLNTGIRNATGIPLAAVAREIRVQTGTPVLLVSWDDLETEEIEALQEQRVGGHADEIETSIQLFLQPDLVHMDRAVPDYPRRAQSDYPGYEPGLYSRDPDDPAYSTTGITGDPTLATREKGMQALSSMTREWMSALRGFAVVPTCVSDPS